MKRTQKKTLFHWKIGLITFLLMAFMAVSCDQSPLKPVNPPDGPEPHPNPPGKSGQILGLMKVTISGIGSGQMTASARSMPLNPGPNVAAMASAGFTQPSSNQGLVLDGDGDYAAVSSIHLNGQSFTISFWAKRGPGVGNREMFIIGQGGTKDTNQSLAIGFRDGNTFTAAFISDDLDTGDLSFDHQWHYWTVVYDASNKHRLIYRDGRQVAEGTADADFQGTGTLYIGASAFNGPGNFFKGSIDEVRIWNVARTEEELRATMNQQINPADYKHLVAYYRFNKIHNGTIADKTGGDQDATLKGDAHLGLGAPISGSSFGDGTIQIKFFSNGSFTYGPRPSGNSSEIKGWRYLYATFKVRNATALKKNDKGSVIGGGTPYDTPRKNLTFLAVDTKPNSDEVPVTYNHTAVSKLKLYNGSEPGDAGTIAKNIIPTGRVLLNNAGNIISFGPDVLQVFTEDEVHHFETSLTGTNVNDIFPYGFVVRSPDVTPHERTLPALNSDDRPGKDQFDGIVTFAFKIPLQKYANRDPFEITMMFLAVDDGTTRITRSIQEAKYGGKTAFLNRIAELDHVSTVTLLGGITYNGSISARAICSARVAGMNSSPTATIGTYKDDTGDLSRYYVDAEISDRCINGSSWNTAFKYLQSALAVANSGDQIWVAEGTYYPDEGTGQTDDDRYSTFQLERGVKIYGGFDPDNGDDTFAERNWRTNETILSGDLKQDDGPDFSNYDDNAYNVVTGNRIDHSTVLNGFTITGGNATKNYAENGGGVFNYISSPTLTNLIITGNKAETAGGGMYNESSSPVLTNVTIRENKAGVVGGGMFNIDSSSPVLINVIISNNKAGSRGGGMFNETNSNPVLINVTISKNKASYSGSGMLNVGSTPVIYNSIIWGNTGSEDQITNADGNTPTIKNSIVGSPDPLFTDPANGDYTLQTGSPAIDAGNNAFLPDTVITDLAGHPRIVDGNGDGTATVDMGAYEYQNQ